MKPKESSVVIKLSSENTSTDSKIFQTHEEQNRPEIQCDQ
jgi:hypothetical protein